MARTHDPDAARLATAMQHARRSLERSRSERREAVRQYVGRHWSEEGTRSEVPVNLLSLYVGIVGRSLLAKNPRVLLSTFDRAQKPTIAAMQTWANKEIEVMRLANTLQRIVTDALFSIGICKVALASPAEAADVAWNLQAGQPFAASVDPDDFVFDVHARHFDEVAWIGHRYRVPLEAAQRWLGKKARDLQATPDKQYNEQGDERISMLGRGYQAGDSEEFEDMVELWEIYLPRERQVVTLPNDYLVGSSPTTDLGFLLKQPWIGPDTGPYHILGLGQVPGNAMPKAPVQDLLGLHEAGNRAYRKLIRTLDRIKEVTLVRAGATESGNRIMTGDDGDLLAVDDPKNFQQLVFSGQHIQVVLAIATTIKDLFSFLGGNLELLGGRSPQSKTAAQDQMLNQNASAGIADMQDRTTDHVARVLKALCWYWWKHPQKVMKTEHALPGLPEMSTLRSVYPGGSANPQGRPQPLQRKGAFEDLDIRVDPYSLRHQSPEARLAALNQIVQQIVVPMMPLLQQQGVAFDINTYLRKIGEYLDQPDLNEILTIQEPPEEGDHPGTGKPPGLPASTNRTYTRENVPMRTTQGDDQNRVNTLLGVKTGGAQRNGQPQGAV